MDTTTLKNELLLAADKFAEQGQVIEFMGIAPVYPYLRNSPFIVQVYAPWLKSFKNKTQAALFIMNTLFEYLSEESLRQIRSIEACFDNDDVHTIPKNVLINTANFYLPSEMFDYSED